MAELEAYCGEVASPYPQALTYARHDVFAVGAGGGGGAAQMLPATELRRILETAWHSASIAVTTEQRARVFLDAADAAIRMMRDAPDRHWAGTAAHVVVAVVDPSRSRAWIGGVGECAAYHLRQGVVACVHAETRVPGHPGVLYAMLGAGDMPPLVEVSLAPGDKLVLVSHVGVTEPPRSARELCPGVDVRREAAAIVTF